MWLIDAVVAGINELERKGHVGAPGNLPEVA